MESVGDRILDLWCALSQITPVLGVLEETVLIGSLGGPYLVGVSRGRGLVGNVTYQRH